MCIIFDKKYLESTKLRRLSSSSEMSKTLGQLSIHHNNEIVVELIDHQGTCTGSSTCLCKEPSITINIKASINAADQEVIDVMYSDTLAHIHQRMAELFQKPVFETRLRYSL